MRKIIIATHHRLASGMADTLEFLSGKKDVIILDAYENCTEITKDVKTIMESVLDGDEVFVFTDMLGGSVTQYFAPYANDHIHIICGMNLPLVLSIALMHEEKLSENEISSIIEESKQSIIYVNTYKIENNSDDE